MTDSSLMYIDRLGVWVGEFNEEKLKQGIDKKCIDFMKKKTGLDYVNVRLARGDHGEKVLRVWVCKKEDYAEE